MIRDALTTFGAMVLVLLAIEFGETYLQHGRFHLDADFIKLLAAAVLGSLIARASGGRR